MPGTKVNGESRCLSSINAVTFFVRSSIDSPFQKRTSAEVSRALKKEGRAWNRQDVAQGAGKLSTKEENMYIVGTLSNRSEQRMRPVTVM
jgi:hypothetical protein